MPSTEKRLRFTRLHDELCKAESKMAESWEWRVFIPSAQVLGTRLEKYLENACSAENHPALKAPRTDVYVVVNNDNLVQGGDGIGIKHRGRLGNMELKVRICKACDRRLKGLEKWKKYGIGNTSVGDALKTAGLWTGSSGVKFSEADVVEGTVSITKGRTKIKSIFFTLSINNRQNRRSSCTCARNL